MELFEILFFAILFILFPIMEQVLKRRQGKPGEPGPDPMDSEPGEVDPRSEDREPVKAADMVPDDLWAVLTGEQRPPRGRQKGERDRAREAPWSETPEPEPEPAPEPEWEPIRAPWEVEPEEERPAPEPVSLEYRGPEAYSLEELDHPAVSLEKPIPPTPVRHRRFHEKIDRPPLRRRRRTSPLVGALKDPDSLRRAFILSEVLGRPKGLD